jgi:nicotinamide mononucleotide transporter
MPYNLSYIEVVGVVFGLICVILTAKESIWCWPTGIISVVFYGYFYYQQTLYVNVLLHIFYLAACIVGWYQWLYGGKNSTELKIVRTTKKHLLELSIVTLFMFVFLGIISSKITNNKMPYTDALLASMSFTAQWMMNKKLAENWWVWISVDAIYSIVHFQNQNYPSFLMYSAYVIIASIGYYLWIQSIKKSQGSQ